MSPEFNKVIKETTLNNSFEEESLESTLRDTLYNSYSYLHDFQLARIGYEEHTYISNDVISRDQSHIGDLYLNKSFYACFDVDYDVIQCTTRDDYRKSIFYLKEFTILDMILNPKIFTKIPVVMIDNKLIFDYTIFVNKDTTTFKLPFKRHYVLSKDYDEIDKKWVYIDHDIKLFIIDNSFYSRFTFNKTTINLSTDKTFVIPFDTIKNTFSSYVTQKTDEDCLKKFDVKSITKLKPDQLKFRKNLLNNRNRIIDSLLSNGTIFCSFHIPNKRGNDYELGTSFIELKFNDNGDLVGTLPDNVYETVSTCTWDFFISIIHFNDLNSHVFYDGSTENEVTYIDTDEPFDGFLFKSSGIIDGVWILDGGTIEPEEYIAPEIITQDELGNYIIPEVINAGEDFDGFLFNSGGIIDGVYILANIKGKGITHVYFPETSFERPIGIKLAVLEESPNIPYSSPIPVENFMVFKKKKDEDEYIPMHNVEMTALHYPNIYQIIDKDMEHGDKYKLYYFYYEVPELKYSVDFDYYFNFIYEKFKDEIGNSMEQIINAIYFKHVNLDGYTDDEKTYFYEVFDKIFKYKYYQYLYSQNDYLNRYKKLDGHTDDEPLEYKINTLKEWISKDPTTLRNYVLEENKLGTTYHLYTNSIDLSERLRRDTSEEIDRTVVFDEDMYVFSFNNDAYYPRSCDIRVFVDGLLTPILQFTKLFTDYIYIPASWVTDDSYIEIEVFNGYVYNEVLNFNSIDEVKEIELKDIPEGMYPTHADLYYDTDDGYTVLDYSNFKITKHSSRGDVVVDNKNPDIEPVSFTRLEKYSIELLNGSIINKDICLAIKKFGQYMRLTVERDGYLIVKFTGTELAHNFDGSYIRIYDESGRLIPSYQYRIFTFLDTPYIYFFRYFRHGQVIGIDFTPYHFTHICHIDEIEEDNPIINLAGLINKPFDVRYFDIYLNGRRLSLNNVMILSPYQISLVNIKSIYDLDIYEKERDWEYFGIDFKTAEFYFEFKQFYNSLPEEEKDVLIKSIINNQKDDALNIVPNTNEEERVTEKENEDIYTLIEFLVYYFNHFIPFEYQNPDTYQEGYDFLNLQFPSILDTFKVNDKTLMLDPDVLFEGKDDSTLAVFPVGNLADLTEGVVLPLHTFIIDMTGVDNNIIFLHKDDPLSTEERVIFMHGNEEIENEYNDSKKIVIRNDYPIA